MEEVFSKGELHVQKLAGEDEIAQTRTSMAQNNQLNNFSAGFIFNQLLFNITSIDEENRVWISTLTGKPNLIEIIDSVTIRINKALIITPLEDVLFSNIKFNKEVGLLFIDWETSRRFRLNGKIEEDNNYLVINIQEIYGICPKYIQKRSFEYTTKEVKDIRLTKGTEITGTHKLLIENASTFFLGTRGASKKADASHKGGKPGFVKFISSDTIRVPDYSGNSMFNSLGNIYENPNSGLVFIDYKSNKMLQLTGKGEIQFHQENESDLKESGDTGRFWLFKIEHWILTENFNQINWDFISYSPFNP